MGESRADRVRAPLDAHRARVRVRFGFDGKLNEDFIAGLSIATGTLGDPTSTNTTFTNNFDKKTIGLDRAYVTYNPVAHKWLSLTGGKFAYTWQRTPVTFDSDLNPEGFSEKLNFDLPRVAVIGLFAGVVVLLTAAIRGRRRLSQQGERAGFWFPAAWPSATSMARSKRSSELLTSPA